MQLLASSSAVYSTTSNMTLIVPTIRAEYAAHVPEGQFWAVPVPRRRDDPRMDPCGRPGASGGAGAPRAARPGSLAAIASALAHHEADCPRTGES